jgi:hypothetical protein
MANLPPYLQRPGTIAYFQAQSAVHDKACVSRALERIVSAMVDDTPSR